jgi:hypothetical protein
MLGLGLAGGIVFAVLGSTLLLYLYRRFVQHRGITGPARASQTCYRLGA